MQLCYRGAKYQAKITAINTVETKTIAKFLGRKYTMRQADCSIALQPIPYKYRGASYQRGVIELSTHENHFLENSNFIPTAS